MANKQWTSLKAEDIKVNTPYAFTIAPANQLDLQTKQLTDFELVTKDRHKAFGRYVKNIFQHLKGSLYSLYYEVSPLGIQHYHGYIQITDIVSYLLHDVLLLKHIGSFHIKIISDANIWDTYIKKQSMIWKELSHWHIESLMYPKETTPAPKVLKAEGVAETPPKGTSKRTRGHRRKSFSLELDA